MTHSGANMIQKIVIEKNWNVQSPIILSFKQQLNDLL